MARIRTIKPEFFTDEDLQDLEEAHPGSYVMLAFAGLWGSCDKQGVFEWRPRYLKLNILPFLNYEISDTLSILVEAGLVERFEYDDREYGYIPTFKKHQRINGKESQEPAKFPAPCNIVKAEKQRGSGGEAPGKQPGCQEGKGRERKGKDITSSYEEVCPNPVKISGAGQLMMDAWNEIVDKPRVARITKGRETKCRARLKDHSIEHWREIFQRVKDTPFLRGDNDRDWVADFDWIIANEENAAKILEGKYDKRLGRAAGNSGNIGNSKADQRLRNNLAVAMEFLGEEYGETDDHHDETVYGEICQPVRGVPGDVQQGHVRGIPGSGPGIVTGTVGIRSQTGQGRNVLLPQASGSAELRKGLPATIAASGSVEAEGAAGRDHATGRGQEKAPRAVRAPGEKVEH